MLNIRKDILQTFSWKCLLRFYTHHIEILSVSNIKAGVTIADHTVTVIFLLVYSLLNWSLLIDIINYEYMRTRVCTCVCVYKRVRKEGRGRREERKGEWENATGEGWGRKEARIRREQCSSRKHISGKPLWRHYRKAPVFPFSIFGFVSHGN